VQDISELLDRWRAGSLEAGEEVLARTYDELRRIAHAHLRRERNGHSLPATALLHEAYLRLLRNGPGSADTREAFFRLMAAEMRHRLVDHARRRLADKRGGRAIHLPLQQSAIVPVPEDNAAIEETLARMDAALAALTVSFPRAARVVQLRFLAGLTTEETARELGMSAGTVKREWTFARAWLAAAMEQAR
jgi:RNA polymerase sigma factor (TIGR02999 family)